MTFVDDTVYLATVDGNNDCGGAGMLTSMPIRLVIFAYVVLLMLFCLRWGGWGDVNVHAHAACDIRLCLPSYVLLLSLGGGGGVGWGGDVNVHADAACDIRLCVSSYFLLLSWGRGWGGGMEGGDVDVRVNDFLHVSSDASLRRPRLFCDCLLNLPCRTA